MAGEDVERIKLLVLLNFPEPIRNLCVQRLQKTLPEFDVVGAETRM